MCFIITVPVSDASFDAISEYLDTHNYRFSLSEERRGALDIQVINREDSLRIQSHIRSMEQVRSTR